MGEISVRLNSEGKGFMGFMDIPEMCANCNKTGEYADPYIVTIDGERTTICKDCLEKLYDEIGYALHKTVRPNDTVWELTQCDDGVWRIFPMVVKSIAPYGSVRWVKGKEPTVWNIYAEGDSTYMYKNFYDTGKTLFFTEESAKAALAEK